MPTTNRKVLFSEREAEFVMKPQVTPHMLALRFRPGNPIRVLSPTLYFHKVQRKLLVRVRLSYEKEIKRFTTPHIGRFGEKSKKQKGENAESKGSLSKGNKEHACCSQYTINGMKMREK